MTSGFPDGYFKRPTVAQTQDHLDSGTDNYLPDRDFARDLVAAAPWLPASVRVNRAHGPRVLNCLTREHGITQVIDLGCGLPHDDNRDVPGAVRRMVYVDSDPMVEAHARMALAERHGTTSLRATLEDMPALLAAGPVAGLNRGRPMGVLLHDVLPWLDDETAHTTLAALRSWLPSGSVLSVTHATTDTAPETMTSLTRLLDTTAPTYGEALTTCSDVTVTQGERISFTLTWHPSHRNPPAVPDAEEALEVTEKFWTDWASHCTYDGPYREAVVRSLITLKALTYAPTGGMVAAPHHLPAPGPRSRPKPRSRSCPSDSPDRMGWRERRLRAAGLPLPHRRSHRCRRAARGCGNVHAQELTAVPAHLVLSPISTSPT